MEWLQDKLSKIEDTRHDGYIKHKLGDILLMVMGAAVSGITELAEMMVYFENKRSFYKEHFGIEKYPSKPTLSRVLNMVDGEAVGKLIAEIMRENAGKLGELIAVDGKAIRSSAKKGRAHSFLQILTAYATQSGVTIGQETISYEDKTNEIPIFQSMLEHLDVKGKTITADAMHCQKSTCHKIVEKEGEYVFGLKGNQGGLLEDVKLFFNDSVNNEDIVSFETIEKNGGRVEKRVCRATSNVEWIPNLELWKGLRTIFSITRITTAQGVTKQDTGYYIASIPCQPERLLATARSHWKIESMHWMLDVIWDEDGSGILSENGHKTLNAFRKLALVGHKRYISKLQKKPSVKGNVFSALLNENVLLDVLMCL